MIEVKNLTKIYGDLKAVKDVSFTAKNGEILGFLGPNGAGKSTTMNIITGYIPATEGTVTVAGYDVFEQAEEVKKKIGYLPENPPLYLDMTVLEYLFFVAELKGVAPKERKSKIEEIAELVKLEEVKNRLIKNLSKGYKQRVGIAQALIGDPEVLILDEPTVGLDPKQIIEIRNLIKSLSKKHTIILSSHILPEVSAVCDRVVIINKGEIVAVDTLENLSKLRLGTSRLQLQIEGDSDKVLDSIKKIHGVVKVEVEGQQDEQIFNYAIDTDPTADVRKDVFFAMAKAKMPILEMKNEGASLEDVFLQLTTHEAVEEGGQSL
jgi:ABC-2 type transport system ATP-binding protein